MSSRGVTKQIAMASAVVAAVGVLAIACGGSQRGKWTDKDTETLKDMSSAALLLEEFCARGEATDAGTCQAAAVRQVEVGQFCAASGRLLFHGQSVVSGGPSCARTDGGS
jgi:hypothetical protein